MYRYNNCTSNTYLITYSDYTIIITIIENINNNYEFYIQHNIILKK